MDEVGWEKERKKSREDQPRSISPRSLGMVCGIPGIVTVWYGGCTGTGQPRDRASNVASQRTAAIHFSHRDPFPIPVEWSDVILSSLIDSLDVRLLFSVATVDLLPSSLLSYLPSVSRDSFLYRGA